MSIYWKAAKQEAQRLANQEGFCWVWSNTELNYNEPYLFMPAHDRHPRPSNAPAHAKCFVKQDDRHHEN